MVLQHGHIVFNSGYSVAYPEIKNIAAANALITKIRAEEPYGENRTEVLSRLNHLLDFFLGQIVFACNANHTYPHRAPQYNWGYIFHEGHICHIDAGGLPKLPNENELSAFDLTIYTPMSVYDFSRLQYDAKTETAPVQVQVHRTENAEIIFEHGGQMWRSDDPRSAINAMLSVAAGKNSKNLAWSLAYQAVEQCRVYFPEIAENLKTSLGNGRYPESVTI